MKTAGLRSNPIFNSQTLEVTSPRLAPSTPDLLNASNRQLWYQITKPMILGNVRIKKIDFAKQNLISASIAYNELNRKISYEVAMKWMEVWLLKTNLYVFKEAKETLDSLLFLNSNRLEEGNVRKVELIRTRLLSDQYHIQFKALENKFNNELRNLNLLMGNEEPIDININTLISYDFIENQESLVKIAIDKRSDLAFAKSDIELSKRNIRVQKAFALPYFEGGVIFNPQNLIPYVGAIATISIPIFSRNQGGIEKSIYLLRQTESVFSAKERIVKVEVINAYNSFITNKKNLEDFQHMEDQSILLMKLVRDSYLKGTTTLIDYLEAQRTNLETQRLYNESMYDFRKSYIDILYTTGLIAEF